MTYEHEKAPITPFLWCCLITLVLMALIVVGATIFIVSQLSKS